MFSGAYTLQRVMKAVRIIAAVALLAFIIASLWLAYGAVFGRSPGSTDAERMNALENWCAGQIHRIADDLLTPTLQFSSLRLELPATATMTEVSLTADDVTFISMSSMKLEFRKMPKRGQPLVIKSATFVDPKVRLIGRDEGGLKGFSGFVKSKKGKQYDDGGSSKPSDILAIRHIVITDGMLEWAPIGHDDPMRLEQLSMDLNVKPEADQPGWYAFNTTIDREPIVHLTWIGGISIDTGDLDFDDVELRVDLSEDEYHTLTPQIQDFLRQYQIVGELTMTTKGRVPLLNPEATDLTFDATMKDSNAVIEEFQFPIKAAHMNATFRDMRFTFDPVGVNAFSGRIDSSGYFDFNGEQPFDMTVKAEDILLQDMLHTTSAEPPKFSGKVALNVQGHGERMDFDATMTGSGDVSIEEGNLGKISLFDAIADTLKISDAKRGKSVDTGNAQFTLKGDRLTIDKARIESVTAAARGKGDIFYDGRLDLLINAGALEKVQSLLGPVGDIFGLLTDRLLPVRVTGTWSEPKVTPEPLSIPLGKIGNADK